MIGGQVTKEVRTLALLTALYGWVHAGILFSVVLYLVLAMGGIHLTSVGFSPGTILPILVFGIALCIQLIFVVIGSCLKRGKAKWLAYVGAVLALFNMPLGFALGIYTIIVLGRSENEQGFA